MAGDETQGERMAFVVVVFLPPPHESEKQRQEKRTHSAESESFRPFAGPPTYMSLVPFEGLSGQPQ